MKKRSQIKDNYKWDLSIFCKNDDDFYQKCDKIEKKLPSFEKYKGKLKDKEIIWKYLQESEQFDKDYNDIVCYAYRRRDEDLSDEKANNMVERLNNLMTKTSESLSFVSIELYALPNKLLDDIISDKKFEDYDKMFKDIKKEKKHRLPDEVEKFISGMNFLDGYDENMGKFADVDLKFDDILDSKGKKHKLDASLYGGYINSADRELRKNAFIETHEKFGDYIDFLASNYASQVKMDCFFARKRKYDSALDCAVENEGVSKEVYQSLISSVHKNLPLLFDYFDKKRKLLGLKDFYNYDSGAPLSNKASKKYTYEQAMDLLRQALSPLGEEYVKLLRRAQDERWIDVFPNEHKRSGAYSTSVYRKNPLVLTNFAGEYEDVSTLAHELGHAMHSYFSDKTQKEPKAYYKIFLAEIASTTNELLLAMYMIENAKKKEDKRKYANIVLNNAKATIYRQAMFAEFEEKTHDAQEKEMPLTKQFLSKTYFELNKIYFGKKVKLAKEVQYEWARIPHFFSSFYVYKYAVGMLCACNFVQRILSKEKGALEDYMHFLSSGGKDTPLNILKEAHCDVEDKKTFEKGFEFLKEIYKYI